MRTVVVVTADSISRQLETLKREDLVSVSCPGGFDGYYCLLSCYYRGRLKVSPRQVVQLNLQSFPFCSHIPAAAAAAATASDEYPHCPFVTIYTHVYRMQVFFLFCFFFPCHCTMPCKYHLNRDRVVRGNRSGHLFLVSPFI